MGTRRQTADLIDKELKRARAEYDSSVAGIKRAAPVLEKVKAVADRFDERLVPVTQFGSDTIANPGVVSVLGTEVILEVLVIRFTDVLPVLERLEDALGAEFSRTADEADIGFRRYQMTIRGGVPLEVRAKPDTNRGATCRQVPTGEKKDIYQLECN